MPTLVKAGRYEIIGELGRGAMGVVYKAQDPVIGRTVAVKTIRLSEEGSGLTRPELSQRFQTEARAAGLLTHPNIVVVFDAGEEDGLFYIIMELVEGKSLLALIEAQQQFPLPRVLRIMEQTCAALQFAHERNVVHRDIKPANLMMTADDTLKVTDFGTAKIMQFGSAQQTTHVMGTPSYMSPEQVKGKAVDGRSDIFSLGVVLYEMTTREKPFPGQNITAVIYKIVNEEPIPPRKIDPSIHPGINSVILKALAKDPALRYQNCREFLEDLRNYRTLAGGPESTIMLNAASAPTIASRPVSEEKFASSLGTPARTLPAAGNPAQTPSPRRTGPIAAYEEPPQKAGPLLRAVLILFLLGVIAYGGYQLWPFMQDMLSRHKRQAAVAALPAPENPAPVAAAAPPDTEGAPPPAAPSPDDPAASSARAAAGEKKFVPAISPTASQFKNQMENVISQKGYSGRVAIDGSGNTLTISGRLRPNEHRELLGVMRVAPAAVTVVDHIEYDDLAEARTERGSEASEHPVPEAGHGAIHLLTDVIGARAILKGPTGAEIARCQTPCSFNDLTPAAYQFEVRKNGYYPSLSSVQLNPGEVLDHKIVLQSTSRGLHVKTRPPGADLFIDGVKQSPKTPITVDLKPGSYNIVLKLDGYETYTGNAQVKSNVQTLLEAELTEQSKRQAWVNVQSDTPGVEILIDGVPTGMVTPARVSTTPGMHRVILLKKGEIPVVRVVMVQEGQTVQVNESPQNR